MARPNKGLGHVDTLPGDPQSKRRLRAILSTIGGQQSVDEACDELGLGPTRLAGLREQALLGALAALAPRPVGRPPHVTAPPAQAEMEAMQQRLAELESENTILRARLEVAESRVLETRHSKSAGWSTSAGGRPRPAAPKRRAVP